MTLRIYDTLTREKREFVPVHPGRVGMYVCGMTVQDKPHVGHIRASLSGDLMRRYLLHLGYDVTYVYNFTDVDDKIIDRATQRGRGLHLGQRAQHRRLPRGRGAAQHPAGHALPARHPAHRRDVRTDRAA